MLQNKKILHNKISLWAIDRVCVCVGMYCEAYIVCMRMCVCVCVCGGAVHTYFYYLSSIHMTETYRLCWEDKKEELYPWTAYMHV